jgi:hypothetical protein
VAERSLPDEVLAALRRKGFALRPFRGYLRLVRGLCEIHVRQRAPGEPGLVLEIPVARMGPDRRLTPVLSSYLDQRNLARKGPGTFLVEGDVIRYRAAVGEMTPDAFAEVALAMQETVEKTGLKILNMLR